MAEGYARLVDFAGHALRIGWHAEVEWGKHPEAKVRTAARPTWPEGAGILSSAHDPVMAQSFCVS